MLNGNLKSLPLLWRNLACNLRYSALVEERDLVTFNTRVANEGLPFLTVALPEIGRALDTYHSTNKWPGTPSFSSDDEGLPHFLRKAIKAALEGNSVAVDCVRQLSYIFYKLEVPYETEAIAAFLDNFERSDLDLGNIDWDSDPLWNYTILFTSVGRRSGSVSRSSIIDGMRRLIARVLVNSNPHSIRPYHGSGATACRTPNWKKWSSFRYYRKLDDSFSYSDLFFYNENHLIDDMAVLESSEDMEPRARVCLVPKDSRGPRVISCEPKELMYAQQGLMRKLYDILETNHLTRGQVNFTDQGINRKLAYRASLDDKLATIDLKDASDRISLELVRRVFPSDWLECLEACRSEETVLPNGKVIKLNKFAPMGSSCCFPVEALVFWACAVATTHITHWFEKTSKVYVYGDDIICDSSRAAVIMMGLEAIGLIVNRNKSYVSGPFRESCGGDYHNGYDVTPIRVREVPTKVGTGLDTCADLLNEFIGKFGYEASHSIVQTIEEVVGFVFPRTMLEVPLSIRSLPSASNDVFFRKRTNHALQREEYRVLTTTADVLQRREPDWFELLRKELGREKASKSYPYENRFSVIDSQAEPGWYADTHSARKKWAWVWLG